MKPTRKCLIALEVAVVMVAIAIVVSTFIPKRVVVDPYSYRSEIRAELTAMVRAVWLYCDVNDERIPNNLETIRSVDIGSHKAILEGSADRLWRYKLNPSVAGKTRSSVSPDTWIIRTDNVDQGLEVSLNGKVSFIDNR